MLLQYIHIVYIGYTFITLKRDKVKMYVQIKNLYLENHKSYLWLTKSGIGDVIVYKSH